MKKTWILTAYDKEAQHIIDLLGLNFVKNTILRWIGQVQKVIEGEREKKGKGQRELISMCHATSTVKMNSWKNTHELFQVSAQL